MRVCHNGTHGVVLVAPLDTDEEVGMMLRIGGPHPQSALFRRAASSPSSRRAWSAAFRTCRPGSYSANVMLIIAQDPFVNFTDSRSVLIRDTRSFGFAQRCALSWNYTNVDDALGRLLRSPHVFVVAQPATASAEATSSCDRCLWSWNESAAWDTDRGRL
eukprot:2279854-Prymnesium_polylepis.1